MHKALWAATAALVVFSLVPAQALADTGGLAKPTLPYHQDTAPVAPGESIASITALGCTDPVESGDLSGLGPLLSSNVTARVAADSVSGSSVYPFRSGDGVNKVSFGSFDDGDMIVVLDPWSPTGHAGLFDRRYYSTLSSFAIWSANTTPVKGVLREPCAKYRGYDAAYGLDVPGKRAYRQQARNFAARQIGKPYSLFYPKTDTRTFYCSKLAWAAWYFTAKVDLDGDRGFWVWPADLIRSPSTRVFGFWT